VGIALGGGCTQCPCLVAGSYEWVDWFCPGQLEWNCCLCELQCVLPVNNSLWCCVPGHRLNITAENDCRRLHCSLRDLSSLLQAVGRLAEYFIGDVFAARFSDALTVVER
jgi:hypothetical protein